MNEVQRYVWQIKREGPCCDCGQFFPFVACYEFDHCRGEKKFCLSQVEIAKKSWPDVMDELSKCDLVCATCHRVRTQLRHLRRRRNKRGFVLIENDTGAMDGVYLNSDGPGSMPTPFEMSEMYPGTSWRYDVGDYVPDNRWHMKHFRNANTG